MVRGLVRPGGDLLVISLFRVEKAREEAKELPTVTWVISDISQGTGLLAVYLQTSLKAQF